MIYFTADHHFNHKRIIEYCNRPFQTIDGMNNILIDNYNKVVNPKDVVYFLGDFALYAQVVDVRYFLNRMNGTKFLIRGNHDKLGSKKYREAGFEGVYEILELNKFTLVHRPNWDLTGRVLCGHIHEKWQTKGKHINVGVDVWDFYPVVLEVLEKLE